jgi:hypothetical protein
VPALVLRFTGHPFCASEDPGTACAQQTEDVLGLLNTPTSSFSVVHLVFLLPLRHTACIFYYLAP